MATIQNWANRPTFRSLLSWAINQLIEQGVLSSPLKGARWGEAIQANGAALTDGDVVHTLSLRGEFQVLVRLQPTSNGSLSIHVGANHVERPIAQGFDAEDALVTGTLNIGEGFCWLLINERWSWCQEELAKILTAMNAHPKGYLVKFMS